jgi:hypothetical protein
VREIGKRIPGAQKYSLVSENELEAQANRKQQSRCNPKQHGQCQRVEKASDRYRLFVKGKRETFPRIILTSLDGFSMVGRIHPMTLGLLRSLGSRGKVKVWRNESLAQEISGKCPTIASLSEANTQSGSSPTKSTGIRGSKKRRELEISWTLV